MDEGDHANYDYGTWVAFKFIQTNRELDFLFF